jgi:hypothetical protein
MATIVAYCLTFLAVYFALTIIPMMLVGAVLGRIIGPMLSAFIGFIISWSIVNVLWVLFEGSNVPIAALLMALAFIFIHGWITKDELTTQSQWMKAAEAWAIIGIGVYLVVVLPEIRWF